MSRQRRADADLLVRTMEIHQRSDGNLRLAYPVAGEERSRPPAYRQPHRSSW